ncbi:MAG: DUF2306 domain-containing protein [Pseudomonadota bacterium]
MSDVIYPSRDASQRASLPAQGFRSSQHWVRRSARSWLAVAALGQLAFVLFILAFYGVRTAVGDYAGWDDKPHIEAYTNGDFIGNLLYISHVLMAVIITLGGLHQLVPAIRTRWPVSHRLVGRVFVITAYFMAFSGLWLTWVRGSYLVPESAIPTTVNALLIIWCVTAAWFTAMRRSFASHRRWALRAFLAANGVWFFRIGIMAWVLINQGPRGMNATLSGPADFALSIGSYTIPLLLLELYFLAQASSAPWFRRLTSTMLFSATAVTALGVFGTVVFMWLPHV